MSQDPRLTGYESRYSDGAGLDSTRGGSVAYAGRAGSGSHGSPGPRQGSSAYDKPRHTRDASGSGAYGNASSSIQDDQPWQEEPGTSGPTNGRYTADEQQMLDQAKRVHRRTTDSASNALQTALKARELGGSTLEELDRQGKKLELIEGDLNEIDADVKEAKGILAYMRRCCLCFLFACCCDCDPNKERDETRKERMKMRKAFRAQEAKMHAEAGGRPRPTTANPDGAGVPTTQAGEDAQRGELLGNVQLAQKGGAQRDNPALRIGQDLEDEDRDEVQAETRKQEKHLDDISDVLGDLKRLGNDMHAELGTQNDRLTHLNDRTTNTLGDLKMVQTSARQDFNIREKQGSSGFSGGKIKGAMYAAKAALK